MWTLYHNQNCSKSREAVRFLREEGIEYRTINYLETPPTIEELKQLLEQLDCKIDEMIRKNEAPFKAVESEWDHYDDEEKIAYIVEHPILIQRPIIVHNERAVIGRPLEAIERIR